MYFYIISNFIVLKLVIIRNKWNELREQILIDKKN